MTMKVEVGRRGRGGDAFALVAFGRDPAVATSAIAAPVFNVVLPSAPNTGAKAERRLRLTYIYFCLPRLDVMYVPSYMQEDHKA